MKLRSRNIIRAIIFAVFFGIGVGAVAFALLVNELRTRYYMPRKELARVQRNNKILAECIHDYEALLELIENDPNIYERIAAVELRTESSDPNVIRPKAKAEQLAAARRVLAENKVDLVVGPAVPEWVMRCMEPGKRSALFLAGAFLILVSLMWFGSAENRNQKE